MLMRLLLSAIQLTASPCLLQSTLHCQKLSLYNSAPSRNHRGREHFCSVSEIGLGTGEMWVESFLSQNGCVTLVLALAQLVSPLPLLVPSIQSASVPSLKPKKDSDFTLLHRAVVPVPYTALLPHTVPLCRSWGHLLYSEDGCQPGAETLCRKKTGRSHISVCSHIPAPSSKGLGDQAGIHEPPQI